jgi:nitrite reductase/ring-hydroxylating ferredoxin subunit
MAVVMEMTIANVPTTELDKDSQPTSLQGFLTNNEWDQLLSKTDHLVSELEKIKEEKTRKKVFELLDSVDQIHRESLTRLVRLFKDGVLEQVITDPPIRTLMDLYDLLPSSVSCSSSDATSVSVKSGKIARWIPSKHKIDKLKESIVYSDQVEDAFIFLCLVGKNYFAFSTDCLLNKKPMFGASIKGFSLVCPHHKGCLYDIRNGARLGSDAHLGCYPVKTEKKKILIGLDMPFVPNLPSF